MAGQAVEARLARRHEGHLGDALAMAGQHLGGLRPLQGDERAVVGAHEADALRQTGGDMGEVLILAGRIDDQHQDAVLRLLGRARHHQIVENAALLVEELRVALAPGSEVQDIGRHEGFERLGGRRMVAAHEEGLAHMRNVEEAGARPRVEMLGENAGRILHRHLISGEGHHAGAERHMGAVEGRGFQRRRGCRPRRLGGGLLGGGFGCGFGHRHSQGSPTDARHAGFLAGARPLCPET